MRKKIIANSIVIALGSALSMALGFGRDILMGAIFGASSEMDAYLVGFLIPDMIYGLMITGVLAVAFVPFVVECLVQNPQEAKKLGYTILSVVVIALGIIVIIGEITARWLVLLIAPSFDPSTHELATSLMRIALFSLMPLGISGVVAAILYAYNDFVATSLARPAFNIVVIVALVMAGMKFGIEGLAIGTVLAALIQLLVQVPALLHRLGKPKVRLELHQCYLVKMGSLLWPMMVGTIVAQGNVVVERILASGLTPGSISALNYAFRILSIPGVVLGGAIATSLFPVLSEEAATREAQLLSRDLSRSLEVLAFMLVPCAIFLLTLSRPIVSLFLQRGAFGIRASEMTATALAFYSLGLVPMGINLILSRVFYAFRDAITPMIVTMVYLLINIAVNVGAVAPLQHRGLALGYSAAQTVMAIMLVWRLQEKRCISIIPLFREIGKMGLAGVGTGLVSWWVYSFLIHSVKFSSRPVIALITFLSIVIGLCFYLGTSILLQIRGLRWVYRFIGLEKVRALRVKAGQDDR